MSKQSVYTADIYLSLKARKIIKFLSVKWSIKEDEVVDKVFIEMNANNCLQGVEWSKLQVFEIDISTDPCKLKKINKDSLDLVTYQIINAERKNVKNVCKISGKVHARFIVRCVLKQYCLNEKLVKLKVN